MESGLFDWALAGVFIAAPLVLVVLVFISAPYGRHIRTGWGPTLPSRLAWVVMETPPILFFGWVYFQGAHAFTPVPSVLFFLWQIHYVHRGYIYPFRLKISNKSMPLVVALLAIFFNVPNSYVNARWISHLGLYDNSWFFSPMFMVGASLFVIGLVVNIYSDTLLIFLRKDGKQGYKIPGGGLYRWVSCPNYLGELLEWLGWAIATWSMAGLSFFIFTAANLIPRAWFHHRWYQNQFEEYPKERKALVPYLF